MSPPPGAPRYVPEIPSDLDAIFDATRVTAVSFLQWHLYTVHLTPGIFTPDGKKRVRIAKS